MSSTSLSQFEIKPVCRLMSNCGTLRIILFLPNASEIFGFEMQRTNSCSILSYVSLDSNHLDI